MALIVDSRILQLTQEVPFFFSLATKIERGKEGRGGGREGGREEGK